MNLKTLWYITKLRCSCSPDRLFLLFSLCTAPIHRCLRSTFTLRRCLIIHSIANAASHRHYASYSMHSHQPSAYVFDYVIITSTSSAPCVTFFFFQGIIIFICMYSPEVACPCHSIYLSSAVLFSCRLCIKKQDRRAEAEVKAQAVIEDDYRKLGPVKWASRVLTLQVSC